ncbi:Transposon Ty3-I Gag-Pol polyprotein [Vitis vinifera]|uniref:Transposon Ty3-I Gag-Pol polyprotein n=1 Tax=Vitis vinifera TaxID=29760 RepID=A0A438IVY5_VITVI|nr:Transposon Ty3-I Gag-Pol polyprotein [Vitis vinifera]
MMLCFPDEIDDHGTFAEIGDVVDGSVPRDEYVDEMLAMSLSQTEEIAPPELASPFDLFGVFVLEIAEEIQVAPTLEVVEDVIVAVDLIDGPVGLVEGVSDFVDSPLSFDVLSGFVSLPDYVSDFSSMDLSIFEYLPISSDIDLSAPSSPTSQIFDIDDEIAQHDSDDGSSSPRELRIGSDLSVDERDNLIQLLRAYLDVFAWSYEDMPGLDPSIVQHLVKYPEWLANVVPVPKKDGKVRVCVDFRDLNKASPNDDFPLPHIDMLVDSTTSHSMLSFMDGFSGYSQILMAPEDMEKTSFITEWGTYCYRVMPFGLKKAGATY